MKRLCILIVAVCFLFTVAIGFSLYEPVGKIYKDELLDTLSDETGTGVTVFGKEASK